MRTFVIILALQCAVMATAGCARQRTRPTREPAPRAYEDDRQRVTRAEMLHPIAPIQ